MFHVLRLIWKLLEKVSNFVNSLPLGGKLQGRKTIYWAYSGPPERRFVRTIGATLFIAAMVLGHGIQALMGIELYNRGISLPISFIGLSYAVVNALVTYTQSILFIRLWIHFIRFRNRGLSSLKPKAFSIGYQMLCIAMTFGGQLIFLWAYAHINL